MTPSRSSNDTSHLDLASPSSLNQICSTEVMRPYWNLNKWFMNTAVLLERKPCSNIEHQDSCLDNFAVTPGVSECLQHKESHKPTRAECVVATWLE